MCYWKKCNAVIQQLKKQKTLAFLISFCILMCIHCQKDTPIKVYEAVEFEPMNKRFDDTTGTTKVINGEKYTILQKMLFKSDGEILSLTSNYIMGSIERPAHELLEDHRLVESQGIKKYNHFELLDNVFIFNTDTLNIKSRNTNWVLCPQKKDSLRWYLFEGDWRR